ncbi:MAG: phosphate propanoyltransferase [Nanoarchaeota archaeon]
MVTKFCPNAGNANYVKPSKSGKVLVEVSAHHIHLSREHVEKLFGKGYELKVLKPLSQPGQFACEERVTLINGKNRMENVRILGPERPQSQVELAITDCLHLGLNDVPVRMSGDLKGTPGIKIEGPKGSVNLKEGVIIAARHIHINPDEAKKLGIRNNQKISVKVDSERSTIFEKVIVRVSPKFSLAVHLDTDEGNAAEINHFTKGKILKN